MRYQKRALVVLLVCGLAVLVVWSASPITSSETLFTLAYLATYAALFIGAAATVYLLYGFIHRSVRPRG